MYTTFGSLNTSLQALHAMQQSIQLSAHNISNANTEGYSRQKTVLAPGQPYSTPANNRYAPFGQVGTGVTVQKLQRFRDNFLDTQIRNETLRHEGWEVRRDMLQQAEVIWNEPSDTSLNSRLSAFWEGWKNLATNPDNAAIRTNVIEAGNDLATTIDGIHQQFLDLKDELNNQVGRHVESINDLAQEIASLNDQIRKSEGIGQQPNDLLDQRDKLLTELSSYINIEINESETGTAMVSIGGRLLVMDQVASPLAAVNDPVNGMLNKVVWADTGATVQVAQIDLDGSVDPLAEERLGGKLGGVLIARDIMIDSEISSLNDIASTIIDEVNALHINGFGLDGSTGLNFFDGTNALDIAVDSTVKADGNKIAAASTAASVPGDGYNALTIGRLENGMLMNSGTTTINEYHRANIAELGQQTRQAILMTENQELLVDHLEERQEQLAGVSLDEETANLLQYQHSYQAAARVMTTVDEMLETVINKMGLVGR